MKKILLSAAAFAVVAVSSIAVAPTTSEAIPAFARQTSAACLSCHFQTFPAINAFGRSFKYNSFTDMGDQGLVEDDHLSIPVVLNATFVLRGNVTNTSETGKTSSTTWTVPADAVIMFAGRVGTNSGAFIEYDAGAANWQFLNSFDIGDFKVGLGAHNTGFGGSGVLEVSNVFGQHGGKLNGKGISAIQAAGFAAQTTGLGAWIGNDLGYIQASLIAPAGATTGAVNVGLNLGKLVRVVATLDVAGFDTLIGLGIVAGNAGKSNAAVSTNGLFNKPNAGAPSAANRTPMQMQFVDLQMQGDLGDISVGLYADWAHAKGENSLLLPAGPAGNTNFYGNMTDAQGILHVNAIGNKFDAMSARVEIKPFDRMMFGIGYGYQKLTGLTALTDLTRKTLQLAATYEIYQNFEINFVFQNIKTNNDAALPAFRSISTRSTMLEFEALM